jgi:hypothetical protein
MPLDVPKLRQALLDAFGKGMTEPDWSKEKAAQALADAIDAFVKGAEVVGVNVNVVAPNGNPLGTGSQSAPGKLQ